MSRRARIRARLAAVGVTAFAVSAHAQPKSDREPAPEAADAADSESSVEVVVVGEASDLEPIRSAVAPHDFGEATASWRRQARFDSRGLLDAPGGDAAASVRAFIVLSPGRADLYFADRAGQRFLVREVLLPSGLDAVGREAVSQVLTLSVVALLEDHRAGISRSEAERLLAPEPAPRAPAPAPPAPAPEAEAPRGNSSVGAGAFYATKAYGGGVPLVHGPGVTLAFVSDGEHARTALWASVEYELPQAFRAADVGVKWSTTLFRGGVEWLQQLPGSPWLVGARLGLGVDLIDFTPRGGNAESGFLLTAARQTTVAVFTPALKLAFPLHDRLTFSADLFADCYPTRVEFGLERDGAAERVLSPWRVRPGLALGLMLR